MGSYWLVVPNPTQPSLAVNFEPFGEVHTVRNSEEALMVADQFGEPWAVVVGVPVDGFRKRVEWFRHRFPHSRLYLAGGISPFQLEGLDFTTMVSVPLPLTFIKALRHELALEDNLDHVLPQFPASQTAMPFSETTINKEPAGNDQIIAVFSGKGGDGKTTVSAQLGIMLAKRGISTLIIDADYKGNEAEWFRGMGQPPIHSILDFQTSVERDRALLESFLMEKNGLKVLACPPVEMGPIPPEVLERAIQAYKPFYSIIILDLHQGFSPELLLAVQYANKLVAVTIPSDRRMNPFAVTIGRLLEHRINKKHLYIVVNRTHGEADVRKVRTGMQDIIGETFSHYYALPYQESLEYDDDPEFVPITDNKSSEPYPTAFLKLAEAVTGLQLRAKTTEKVKSKPSSTNEKKPGGFFALLFGSSKKSNKKPVKKKAKR